MDVFLTNPKGICQTQTSQAPLHNTTLRFWSIDVAAHCQRFVAPLVDKATTRPSLELKCAIHTRKSKVPSKRDGLRVSERQLPLCLPMFIKRPCTQRNSCWWRRRYKRWWHKRWWSRKRRRRRRKRWWSRNSKRWLSCAWTSISWCINTRHRGRNCFRFRLRLCLRHPPALRSCLATTNDNDLHNNIHNNNNNERTTKTIQDT